MKIVVLGVPHTKTVDPGVSGISDCAYTMKVWNLCRMMVAEGHEVVHVGTEGSNPVCTRNIDVMTHAEWTPVFGDKRRGDGLLTMDMPVDYAAKYNTRVAAAINSLGWPRKSAVVCLPWGGEQLAAVQGVDQFIVASGIGNFHPFAQYRVYESYANLHAMLAQESKLCDPQWYHVVIPNGIDPALFGPVKTEKSPWALFMGRLIENKGIRIAVQACRAEGVHLKIAGPGSPADFVEPGDDVDFLGTVGAVKRAELMREARCCFTPSYYVEPFGNVGVEAAMSGCPVISTDFGAWTEHVVHGLTGFRCRTMDHFRWALRNAGTINPFECRRWAEINYGLAAIGRRYTEYFRQVLDLAGEGWYASHPEREDLGWMTMDYSMFRR